MSSQNTKYLCDTCHTLHKRTNSKAWTYVRTHTLSHSLSRREAHSVLYYCEGRPHSLSFVRYAYYEHLFASLSVSKPPHTAHTHRHAQTHKHTTGGLPSHRGVGGGMLSTADIFTLFFVVVAGVASCFGWFCFCLWASRVAVRQLLVGGDATKTGCSFPPLFTLACWSPWLF